MLFKTKRPDSQFKERTTFNLKFDDNDNFGKIDVNAYFGGSNLSYYKLCDYPKAAIIYSKININSFSKIEFKWMGQVVIPPSLHDSGKNYEFLNGVPYELPSYVCFEKLSELQLLFSGPIAPSSKDNFKPIFPDSDIEIPNKKGNFMFIDCEANGLPISFAKDYSVKNNWPRLLQLSWLICDSEYPHSLSVLKRECRSIKPKNFELDIDGEMIHGLSLEILNLIGEDLRSVLDLFLRDLKSVDYVVCHNYEFDKNVILNEFINYGINPDIFLSKKSLCTMIQSTQICQLGESPYKFPSLAELYYCLFQENISFEHSSIFDVTVTLKCYKKLFFNYKFSYHLKNQFS